MAIAELEFLAASARAEVPNCSVLRIHGANIFRPGDLVYEVKSVTASGTTLRVELFLALDGTTAVVEVEAPQGGKVKRGALKVASAAAVKWNGEPQLRPAGSQEPALHLGH